MYSCYLHDFLKRLITLVSLLQVPYWKTTFCKHSYPYEILVLKSVASGAFKAAAGMKVADACSTNIRKLVSKVCLADLALLPMFVQLWLWFL